MPKLKICAMVVMSCLLGACSTYSYKHGPQEYYVLSKAGTRAASVQKATDEAKKICLYKDEVIKTVDVKVTPGQIDNVQTIDGYFYVVQDVPPTDYFTVLRVVCQPKPNMHSAKKRNYLG